MLDKKYRWNYKKLIRDNILSELQANKEMIAVFEELGEKETARQQDYVDITIALYTERTQIVEELKELIRG